MLAFLLLHADRAVPAERLAETLWDGGATIKAVQVAVARLRRALGPGGAATELSTVAGGYRLSPAPGAMDAAVFEKRVAEGQRLLTTGAARDAATTLREALGLWRGPALADVAYDDFAQDEIRRLEDLRASAAERLLEAELALGRHAEVGRSSSWRPSTPTARDSRASYARALPQWAAGPSAAGVPTGPHLARRARTAARARAAGAAGRDPPPRPRTTLERARCRRRRRRSGTVPRLHGPRRRRCVRGTQRSGRTAARPLGSGGGRRGAARSHRRTTGHRQDPLGLPFRRAVGRCRRRRALRTHG